MNPQICSSAIKCWPYRCCCLEAHDKVSAQDSATLDPINIEQMLEGILCLRSPW